jgi:hypothetical protein
MAYRQYTQCVKPESFSPAPIADAVAATLFTSLLAIVLVILTTGGIGGLAGGAAAALGVCTGLLSFVHWWLYGRLICLGGDRCAIGMVISVEPPSEKTATFPRLDSDYSFNLLLPPLPGETLGAGASQVDVIAKGVHGDLIKNQLEAFHLDFKGESARICDAEKCGKAKCPDTAALHCEFEGAGMYIFYQWLKVIFGLLIAGTIASALCLIPIIGWIACLIAAIALAVAAAAFIAAIVHGNLDAASPSDVDPSLGSEMHQNGCDGMGADLVVVSGEWVYDSLHEGWNEIHPIRHCQRIGTWKGMWPWDDAKAECDKWCGAVGSSSSPLTVANQKEPQNQWTLHPSVDGCKPEGSDNDDDYPDIK